MSADHQLHLVAPFGPTILKATMPEEMVAALNERANAIHQERREADVRDWSRHLAGAVRHEVRVTDIIRSMTDFRDFLHDVARIFEASRVSQRLPLVSRSTGNEQDEEQVFT